MSAEAKASRRDRGAPRVLVVTLALAAAVIVLAGMRAAADILAPVLLGLVVTIAVHPLQRWLSRRIPGWAAATLCLVLVYLVIIGLAVALIASAARLASLLPRYESEARARVADATAWLHHAGVSNAQLDQLRGSLDPNRLTGLVTDVVSSVAGVLSGLVLIVTLLFFTIIDAGRFPQTLRSAASSRPVLVEALVRFAHATCRYLVVSTVFGLVVAVFDTVALVLLGIPAPALWGLLAFLTNYIPNIGFVIGLVPPALLALLEGGPGLMLGVIAIYCVVNLIIQSFIQPKVVGDAVGLSPTLSFLSLVFWSWILGPLGAILAIPMSLLTRAVLIDADPAGRWVSPLVANAGRPARSPDSGDPDATSPAWTHRHEDDLGTEGELRWHKRP